MKVNVLLTLKEITADSALGPVEVIRVENVNDLSNQFTPSRGRVQVTHTITVGGDTYAIVIFFNEQTYSFMKGYNGKITTVKQETQRKLDEILSDLLDKVLEENDKKGRKKQK